MITIIEVSQKTKRVSCSYVTKVTMPTTTVSSGIVLPSQNCVRSRLQVLTKEFTRAIARQ